jgi:4-hydroxybenzoate polyprenyltransferase
MAFSLFKKARNFGKMIKFSHTIFALPFAFSSALLAMETNSWSWGQLLWILLAMVGARTAAMGFNRFIDSDIDAKNPRTKNREIPSGKIKKSEALIYITLSAVLLVYSAYRLNELCFYLSPVALLVIFAYSYTKRFTFLCHIVLGISLSLAPVGAWIAITGQFSLFPVILGIAVLFWVAGFDIIYSCQDAEYDKSEELYSIPVFFGLKRALLIARLFHIVTIMLLFSLSLLLTFHYIFYIGLLVIAFILYKEHKMISVDNLTNIGFAFFNLNAVVSVIFFFSVLSHYLLRQG